MAGGSSNPASRAAVAVTTGEASGATVRGDRAGTGPGRAGEARWLLPAAVVAVAAIPPLVALIALRTPRWYPIFDMALIETAVRDVASGHPPLLGLVGRFGDFAVPGHHPGALGYYALWPFYAAAGGSSWALRFSSFVLTALAFASVGWIASRRGGRTLVVGVAALLALLVATYPAFLPVEPWNPYEPVFWWPVVLLGVWSVLEDDLAVLPLTVFAASLCAETHISYVGLAGGLGAVTAGVLATRAVRRRSDRRQMGRLAAWGGASLALGVVLWIPPVAQQLFGTHPNLSIIWHDFARPPSAALGWRRGAELLLANMNPVRFLDGRAGLVFGGPRLPGGALVVAWAATVVAARPLRDRRPLRLHAVVGAALLLGLMSARSVHGLAYPYLFLWAWPLAALMILAGGWTVAARWRAVSTSGRGVRLDRLDRIAPALAAAALVAFTGVATARAATVETGTERASAALGGVVRPTVATLEGSHRPGYGRAGRYLVTWTDTMSVNGQGWGLVNELLREGLDVGVPAGYSAMLPGNRTRTRSEATALVHLSVGPDIRTWRSCPGAREIALHDPRTAADRAEARRLTARAQARLREVGAADLAPGVETSILTLGLNPRVPADVHADLVRIVARGFPLAVFAASPDVACPGPTGG